MFGRVWFTDNKATVAGGAVFWDTAGFTSVPCDVSGVTFSGNTVNGCVGSGGCARVPVQRHDTATQRLLCAGSQATKARALRRCKRIRSWRCGNQCIPETLLTRFCAPPCTGVARRPSFNATMWVLTHALARASPVVGTPSVSATTSVVPGQALPPITVRGSTVYVGGCPRLQRRPRLTRACAHCVPDSGRRCKAPPYPWPWWCKWLPQPTRQWVVALCCSHWTGPSCSTV